MKTSQNKSLTFSHQNVDLKSSLSSTRLHLASQMRKRFVAILLISVGLLFFSGMAFAQGEFITTWQTTTANESILIPAVGSTALLNYNVEWGDGIIESNINSTASHSYSTAGIYTVKISGNFYGINFNGTPIADRKKIMSIEQWGNIQWRFLEFAFLSCSNLINNATDAPNLSNVTSLASMFQSASSFNGDLSNWNTSNITNMQEMFLGARAFNGNISNWDVSNVTTMDRMFAYSDNFNQNISTWNVSNVTSMSNMFKIAKVFNQPIGSWNVSKVTNMSFMFQNADAFNQNLGSWNVSSVTNMASMFLGADVFNGNVSNWNVSNVTNMSSLFSNTLAFNQNIGSWNVSSVTNMNRMFSYVSAYNQPMDTWNVSNVTDMNSMFLNATSFNQNLGSWNIGNVADMTSMLDNTAVSRLNYDTTLIGWAGLVTLPVGITLGATGVTYCKAANERAILEGVPNNWVIADGGLDCSGPTDILLSNASINELNSINEVIGQLSAINTYGTNIYILTSGTGDTDNASFTIAGSNLQANEIFDYETKSSYSIRVRIDDSNAIYEKVITITIGNVSGITQGITFNTLTPATYGEADFGLSATASSGLAVAFASSDPTVATITGSTVTIVGAGTTTITASQTGDDDYAAATDVQQILTINKSNQTITFDALAPVVFDDPDFDLAATTSSGLLVTYVSSDETVATITGSTVTIVGTGTTTITASQAGDNNYTAASNVQQTLTINKANQTITFDALTLVSVGDEAFDLTATASSGLTITYTSSDPTVATVTGITVTILGLGTATITASQPGDVNYNAATDVQQTLTINKRDQAITFATIDNQPFEAGSLVLSATSSSGLDVAYSIISGPATVSGNVITFSDLGIITIEASQGGDDSFNVATPVQQTFEVITITATEKEATNAISIFPNPTSDFITVKSSDENIELALINMNGVVVLKLRPNQSTDLTALDSGLYLLRIKDSNGIKTKKIIKQ